MDCTYIYKSPRKLNRQLEEGIDKAESMKIKLMTRRLVNGRLHDRVDSLASAIYSLKEERVINNDQAEILNNTLPKVPSDILNRLVSHTKGIFQ